MKKDLDNLLDDVIDIGKTYNIISGVVDVDNYYNSLGTYQGNIKKIKKFNEESYYQLIGNAPDEMIIETMVESDCEVDKSGEYEFYAVLSYVEGETDDCGRYTMRDYLEISHIRWNLIQTFEQRDRQYKLDQILESDNIFNF